jgi:hypothetical protein
MKSDHSESVRQLAVAREAARPRSVQMTDPAQPDALVNETDPTPLEIALGFDQPKPWPSSIAEEILLAEHNLANPIRDHIPQAAPRRKVRSVLSILDQLDREQSNRRFTD